MPTTTEATTVHAAPGTTPPPLTSNPLLRLATAGSVDDGKSTLVGRLLHDTKSVLSDQLAAVQQVSRDRGLTFADLALLTDGLRAEREQGITIDVAYRYFATARRSFILADCPGHVQYTRNTVTGSSTADVVVLLVDARHGVVEQTRRHLAVVALLRVPHVIVAVNKIDLVDFCETVYDGVNSSVQQVARDLGIADARAIPVCALGGDNVVDHSDRMPWYAGPTLLELLEDLPTTDDTHHAPFRMPVQLVIRPQAAALDPSLQDYRGYAGQVGSGVITVGDQVLVLPSRQRSTVVGIDLGPQSLASAVAPQCVTLRLADDLDISRGDVIAAAHDAPQSVTAFTAVIAWLGDRRLEPGTRVLVKHGARTVAAVVATLQGRLDLDTLTTVPADTLRLNDIGEISVRLASPLPVEPYALTRHGGAFLLIDAHDGATLAAGMVRS